MEEFINFIISIIHFLKYDSFVNRNRSFSEELINTPRVEDERLQILQSIIKKELTSLKIKQCKTTPKYAYFERKNGNWFKIIIINAEERFYCRLRIIEIGDMGLPNTFHIAL